MIKNILNMVKLTSGMMLISALSFSQSIINNGSGGINNFTLSGLYTPAPPILDGEATDACWSNALLGGEVNANRMQTNGAFLKLIEKNVNYLDDGVISGPPKAFGIKPATVSASFSVVWDLDYVYYIVKVVDNRLLTPNTKFGGSGVEVFFNNGNGRSAFEPGVVNNFPSNYEIAKDMQVIADYVMFASDPTKLIKSEQLRNGDKGIQIGADKMAASTKATIDGYIIEGKVSWKGINSEFIDPITEVFKSEFELFKPKNIRVPIGFDISVNVPNAAISERGAQLMWNQCCWNTNWSQSQHFGYLQLIGSPKLFTATGVTIENKNVGPIAISTAAAALELKATILPADAPQSVKWSVSGTITGGFPIATIDELGKLTPLNNGTVTVTATTFPITITDGSIYTPTVPNNTVIPSISQTSVIVISNQNTVNEVVITAPGIVENWGKSKPAASTLPANSPNAVSWSMIDVSGLATMNTLTGEVTSTALNNGTVTIVGTSLANGTVGKYVLPITLQSPIDCFALNSFTNINQTLRTKNNLTFSGFSNESGNKKTRIILRPQYLNQFIFTVAGVGTTPGNFISEIPADLVSISGVFSPAGSGQISKSGSGWEISFNNTEANPVTITAVYMNDKSKTTRVIAKIKSASPTTSPGTGYAITNKTTDANPGCNNFGITVTTGGLDFANASNSFQLFPNPASESITVTADDITSVSIFSLVGKEVLSSNVLTNSLTLSTSGLTSGVYLVRVKRKGGQTSTQKLIISK